MHAMLWHDRFGFVVLQGDLWQGADDVWYGTFGVDYMGMTANLPMTEVQVTFL